MLESMQTIQHYQNDLSTIENKIDEYQNLIEWMQKCPSQDALKDNKISHVLDSFDVKIDDLEI